MNAAYPPPQHGSSFRNVHNWDDGYEYVMPDRPVPDHAVPPPPKQRHRNSTSRYEPSVYEPSDIGLPKPPLGRNPDSYHAPPPYRPHPHQQPSPPRSGSDDYVRPRHGSSRRERSPPAAYGMPAYGVPTPARSPSPPRRRARDTRDTRHPPPASHGRPRRPSLTRYDTAPPLRSSRRSDGSPAPRRRGGSSAAASPSPSPPPPRHRGGPRSRDRGADTRPHYSRGGRAGRDPGMDRGRERFHPRDDPRPYAPSPPPAVGAGAAYGGGGSGRRPPISRSKTTANTPPSSRGTSKPGTKGGKNGVAGVFSGISPRWQKAATAALHSGAAAAMNLRTQPGAWNGEKGARVATAALGAAALDAFSGGKKEEKSGSGGGSPASESGGGGKGGGRGGPAGGKRNSEVQAISGALGGFLADQISRRNSKKDKRH